MRKLVLAIAVLAIGAVSSLQAIVFMPNPVDLGDLEHSQFYVWAIQWAVPSGQQITNAVLKYHNIWDWTAETDHLYTNLLPGSFISPSWIATPPITVKRGTDNEGGGNYFNGNGILIGNWNDPVGGQARNFDLVYDFNADQLATLNTYAQAGMFGFGIDPDCHYYNCGVTFDVTTAPVPEPATMVLLGIGLVGAAGFRKKLKA